MLKVLLTDHMKQKLCWADDWNQPIVTWFYCMLTHDAFIVASVVDSWPCHSFVIYVESVKQMWNS